MDNSQEWDLQATAYEKAQISNDSLDTLVEYPAQLKAIGNVEGKSILDIACGSGRKAYDLIKAGAKEVYAFDISDKYERPWGADENKPENLHFFICDLNHLHDHELLTNKQFDIALSLQATGYPENPLQTYKNIHCILKTNARFIYTTPHPMRYAMEKSQANSTGLGSAYHDQSSFSYDGVWNKAASSTSYTMTISQRINMLIDAGFLIEGIEEPFISDGDKEKYPHKFEWMNKYFGMILYKLRTN